MSFFKKAMASVFGVGGTKVDTVLNNSTVILGETVSGVINIYGGEVSQEISNVYIDINTTYEKEADDNTYNISDCVQRFTYPLNQTVNPGDNLSFDFEFKLGLNCPITKGHSKVWLSTRLDIENAVDDTDRDYLNVRSNDYTDNVLTALRELGFRIKSTKNIFDKHRLSPFNFVQEFEYSPSPEFRGRLDEIEVVIVYNNSGAKLVIEVDRRVRGLGSLISENLGLDETLVSIDLSFDELSSVNSIASTIRSSVARFS